MQAPFSFKQPYLLAVMGVVLVAAAAIAYETHAWSTVLLGGFVLLMLAGGSARIRAGVWWGFSYPAPNQAEGTIGAIGVSAMFGALAALATFKLAQWLA